MIIVWRLLDSCNLSCPFCAYDKRLGHERLQIDSNRVRRFIDLLAQWHRPVLLSWLGGEPLLWPELEGLTTYAKAAGIEISTTTNGTTLGSPKVRKHLLLYYSEVTISVDGFASFHDQMRGWKGGFDKLKQSVLALTQERLATQSALKLRVNVVLMRDNIADFEALCHELGSWGVDEICFNQLGGRDRPEFYPAHRLTLADIDRLEALLPDLRAALGPYGTRLIGGADYVRRIRGTALDQTLPMSGCRVSENFLFIDELGRVAPCSFAPEHFNQNIDTLNSPQDLEALISGLIATQAIHPAPDCADCPSTQQFAKWA